MASLAAIQVAPASAAQRLESFELPSAPGNIDLSVARLNRATSLRASVLLPDGYDADPAKAWPVLYLLHGIGDDSTTWSQHNYGDILERAAGFPGIIVMPEGGRGWYTDAWQGGSRRGINWERYFLDDVVPTVQSRYRILPGRDNHSIAGMSMGGYGAVLLAAQLPSYFGTAVSMSGLLDIQNLFAEITVPAFGGFSYTRVWGRFDGDYAIAHNPTRLLPNLKGTRLYVSTGNGIPNAAVHQGPVNVFYGAPSEAAAYHDAVAFTGVARAAGLSVKFSGHTGLHTWPYWQHEIVRAIDWGVFGPTPGDNPTTRKNFSYLTMAPHGNAWGLGFTFATPPQRLLTLRRLGQTLTATGAGTLTITPGAADADASGAGTQTQCAFTATLPFTRSLPAGC